MRRRHHEFLHHWDGQRALIEHEVVKLQHIEILPRLCLILFAECKPFALAHKICGQLSRAKLRAHELAFSFRLRLKCILGH